MREHQKILTEFEQFAAVQKGGKRAPHGISKPSRRRAEAVMRPRHSPQLRSSGNAIQLARLLMARSAGFPCFASSCGRLFVLLPCALTLAECSPLFKEGRHCWGRCAATAARLVALG